MLDIIEIFKLLDDKFSCEWCDSSIIGITQRKIINDYSLEELANKVENVLNTLDNLYTRYFKFPPLSADFFVHFLLSISPVFHFYLCVFLLSQSFSQPWRRKTWKF